MSMMPTVFRYVVRRTLCVHRAWGQWSLAGKCICGYQTEGKPQIAKLCPVLACLIPMCWKSNVKQNKQEKKNKQTEFPSTNAFLVTLIY